MSYGRGTCSKSSPVFCRCPISLSGGDFDIWVLDLKIRYKTGKHQGTKVELISSVKISTGFVKGCQSRKGNAGWWWQWCVTAELTNSGIRISEVRSLPGLDITGLAASPLTFPGGLACHGRSNQLVGGNVMSLLTGGEQAKCCSWGWSQSRPHRVNLIFVANFAKFRQKSQKIDLNRIIRQRIFWFLKFEIFLINIQERNIKFCFTWYPNDITLCLWSGFIYPRIRTFDRKTFPRSLFQKKTFEIRFMHSDSWNEAEVNFFRREKISRRDYLDYLKNKAKSGEMAVLQLTFRKLSLGK